METPPFYFGAFSEQFEPREYVPEEELRAILNEKQEQALGKRLARHARSIAQRGRARERAATLARVRWHA